MEDPSQHDCPDMLASGSTVQHLPTRANFRAVPADQQEKKCFYCRQDRQKCEWVKDQKRCQRCENLKYTCSLDTIPASADSSRRVLRFAKCSYCRQARQKCLPVDRIWPAHCDRCVAKGLPCTAPLTKHAESRQPALNQTTMSAPEKAPFLLAADHAKHSGTSSKRQKLDLTGTYAATVRPEQKEQDGPEFRYEPLKKGEFRILELHRGTKDEEIVCELRVWNPNIQYDTVSYLRSFEDQIPLTVLSPIENPKKFIMPNLYAALKYLRFEDKSRYLWINALCIDHSSVDERSEHVHVIRRIFGQAKNVYLWLGEPDGSTNGDIRTAIDFANELVNPGVFDRAVRDVERVAQWNAILNLLRQSLFERRWVALEVVIAGKATILYGDGKIDWPNFVDIATMFERAEGQDQAITRLFTQASLENLPTIGDARNLSACRFINLIANISEQSKKNVLSLENLVHELASFKSWDVRDAIYACVPLAHDFRDWRILSREEIQKVRKAANKFLGLFRRKVRLREKPVVIHSSNPERGLNGYYSSLWTETTDLDAKREIDTFLSRRNQDLIPYNVDYRMPVLFTYREFITHVLRTSKSLGILCRPWAPKKRVLAGNIDGKVPSWIATLDRAAFDSDRNVASYVRVNADPLVGAPGKEPYNASLGLPASWTFPITQVGQPMKLYVDGFVLTKISETRSEAVGGNISVKWLEFAGWDPGSLKIETKETHMYEWEEQMSKGDQKPDLDDQCLPDSLWRTLVGDRDLNGGRAPLSYRSSCQAVFVESNENFTFNTVKLLEHTNHSKDKEFIQRIQEVVWNRKLIRTGLKTKGGTDRRYLGLAPEGAERGDLICILYGCSVPVVIREMDDGHELIGECYIDGMMDGAALGLQIAENIPKTTFRLV
ncbi:uncharacterized protein PV09_08848 [Verruconis gallopava]|uniref:Heterokaryon incompatibility domain-containing protein n=1 Tax=Verruconis gallopava TaxID=253628 RepID=A0A0D2AKM5_9PEZI|nr:uncharacterized protein PV09_08848 [Verruconis gallopava]KIV99548.1 hypothetical protein PV09_08848 [Verruconis gallopava]